jgi:hypothetical protein
MRRGSGGASPYRAVGRDATKRARRRHAPRLRRSVPSSAGARDVIKGRVGSRVAAQAELRPTALPELLDVSGQPHACTAQISVFPRGAETGPVCRSYGGAGRSGWREAATTPGEYPGLISPTSSVSRNVLPHKQNGLSGQLPTSTTEHTGRIAAPRGVARARRPH